MSAEKRLDFKCVECGCPGSVVVKLDDAGYQKAIVEIVRLNALLADMLLTMKAAAEQAMAEDEYIKAKSENGGCGERVSASYLYALWQAKVCQAAEKVRLFLAAHPGALDEPATPTEEKL